MVENIVPLKPLILLVDNPSQNRDDLSQSLGRHGFIVNSASTGNEALDLLKELKPDIIILNWKLSGLSGIEVCTILRTKQKTKNIPIIMISEEKHEFNKIKGLENGIDDYIIMPFTFNELFTKIKSIFRKTKPVFKTQIIEYKTLKIDVSSYKVWINSNEINLGPTEFKILQCLIEYPKRILSREYIMNNVWGYDSEVEIRTIDVHINRLRNTIKTVSKELDFIKTIRSAGYSLDGPDLE